jgi:hypothetical protein
MSSDVDSIGITTMPTHNERYKTSPHSTQTSKNTSVPSSSSVNSNDKYTLEKEANNRIRTNKHEKVSSSSNKKVSDKNTDSYVSGRSKGLENSKKMEKYNYGKSNDYGNSSDDDNINHDYHMHNDKKTNSFSNDKNVLEKGNYRVEHPKKIEKDRHNSSYLEGSNEKNYFHNEKDDNYNCSGGYYIGSNSVTGKKNNFSKINDNFDNFDSSRSVNNVRNVAEGENIRGILGVIILVYVFIHMYIYVCMYIYVYIYFYMYMYKLKYIYAHMNRFRR